MKKTRKWIWFVGAASVLIAATRFVTPTRTETISQPDFLPIVVTHPVEVEPADVLPAAGVAGTNVTHLYSADEVDLPDDHFVIGVEVDGQARAYLEAGMDQPHTHIVHDRIDDACVAVTFCNRTGDARVFCGPEADLHEMRVGGWRDESMELLVQGSRVALNSPKVPFKELKSQSMKWSEWKRLHPTTRIYIGDHTNAVVQPRNIRPRAKRS